MIRPYSIPVPNQVLMAMQVIEVMDRIRSPKTGFDKKGTPVLSEARTLTEQEQETYNAALMTVKNYLTTPTEVITPPRPAQPEPQPQHIQPAMTDQELAENLGGYPEEVQREPPQQQQPRSQYNGPVSRPTVARPYRPVPRPPGY